METIKNNFVDAEHLDDCKLRIYYNRCAHHFLQHHDCVRVVLKHKLSLFIISDVYLSSKTEQLK